MTASDGVTLKRGAFEISSVHSRFAEPFSCLN
jgi:hypothetical protein